MPITYGNDFTKEETSGQTENALDPMAPSGVAAETDADPESSGSEQNNIDLDAIFDYNDDEDEEVADPAAAPVGDKTKPQEQQPQPINEQQFMQSVEKYAGDVAKNVFNGSDLAAKLQSGSPEDVVASLQTVVANMYKAAIKDAAELAQYYADNSVKKMQTTQKEREVQQRRSQVLQDAISEYPAMQSKQYKVLVDTVYQRALAAGKKPADAAKVVVSYFKKNVPNAVLRAAQTKQTDGASINDIWAKYR